MNKHANQFLLFFLSSIHPSTHPPTHPPTHPNYLPLGQLGHHAVHVLEADVPSHCPLDPKEASALVQPPTQKPHVDGFDDQVLEFTRGGEVGGWVGWVGLGWVEGRMGCADWVGLGGWVGGLVFYVPDVLAGDVEGGKERGVGDALVWVWCVGGWVRGCVGCRSLLLFS